MARWIRGKSGDSAFRWSLLRCSSDGWLCMYNDHQKISPVHVDQFSYATNTPSSNRVLPMWGHLQGPPPIHPEYT